MSDEFELNRKQSFEKREATVEDILLILNVLWRRPHDIPCTPDERHAFHAAVIMAGLGFRPGSVINMRYEQVKLYVAPNPATGSIGPYADVTIYHQKQETNKVYTKQDDVLVTPLLPLYPAALRLNLFIAVRTKCSQYRSARASALSRS